MEELDDIARESYAAPCLIFKHSTRCNISSIAKYRIEDDWYLTPESVRMYYLDLIRYRSVSNAAAERFAVHHESPQVLLIRNGECVYDESHLGIRVEEIKEALVLSMQG